MILVPWGTHGFAFESAILKTPSILSNKLKI